jgi:hypothetical protein
MIENLLKSKFTTDCKTITLTQQESKNPITYTGPGLITQNSNGGFYIKIFHKIENSAIESRPPTMALRGKLFQRNTTLIYRQPSQTIQNGTPKIF